MENRVLVYSDGQFCPESWTTFGTHATGRFETSRRNCYLRWIISWAVRTEMPGWGSQALFKRMKKFPFEHGLRVMGDDCVEILPTLGRGPAAEETARKKYAEIALEMFAVKVKLWNQEFCGMDFSSAYPINTAASGSRSLFKFACAPSQEKLDGLTVSFSRSPNVIQAGVRILVTHLSKRGEEGAANC